MPVLCMETVAGPGFTVKLPKAASVSVSHLVANGVYGSFRVWFSGTDLVAVVN